MAAEIEKESKNESDNDNPQWSRRSTVALVNSLVGVTAYLVIGALIFSAMELPQERDRLRDMKAHAEATSERMVDEIVNRTIEKICLLEDWEQCLSRINIQQLYNQSYDMMDALLKQFGYDQFDVQPESRDLITSWDLAGAIYFCITTVTTIGYGNIYPTMDSTRALTILYTIVGIPLFLYCCSQLSTLFSFMFYKCRCTLGVHESSSKRSKVTYYIIWTTIIFGLFFFLPLPLLMHQNDLSFIAALYFLVISVTTVGYGDIYPIDPAQDSSGSALSYRYGFSFMMWIYMVLGISLFANFLQLIQNVIAKGSMSCQNKIESEVHLAIHTVHAHEKSAHDKAAIVPSCDADVPSSKISLAVNSQSVFASKEDFGVKNGGNFTGQISDLK